MNINGIIFDLDGVIVDTAKYHYLAWKSIAEELGINFTLQDNEKLKGVSRVRSLEIILQIGNISLNEESKLEYCERKNELYLQHIADMDETEILPGVQSFLNKIKDKNIKIALGSASKNATFILEKLKLSKMFDAIVDGLKVSKAKPDPEVFLIAAQELGLSPEECIVFEDAIAGVEAAHNAGVRVIGVGDASSLSKADVVVETLKDINLEIIKQSLA